MAFCDYHACDNCGEQKTFYDADHNVMNFDGHWRYDVIVPDLPGYRVWTLCHKCEQTHEIVIRPKEQQP